ncbi:MAG: hypothetical protein NC115_10020, partial [Bacteroidales bacterium]|nr:hypothetical protein [Bacteroides sp.]MCM1502985.1 hypothetical protein [Bacteroidales bacterium]
MINELDRQYAISENYRKGRQEGLAEGRLEGLAEGEKKGRKEGEAHGRKESILEMAKTMKAEGLAVGQIAKITSLPLEVIEALSVEGL